MPNFSSFALPTSGFAANGVPAMVRPLLRVVGVILTGGQAIALSLADFQL